MAGPLIPYITLPEIPILPGKHVLNLGGGPIEIGPWTIKPFGTLVALGVYFGAVLCTRYARRWNLNAEAFSKFVFWVMVIAFAGGHMLDVVFYHPAQLLKDPLSLVRIWDGLSSFGGFIGAAIGVFVFKYKFKIKSILPFADTMGAAFPVGWVFGRMGCSVVHDHPGMRSDVWFAVRFPHGARFDLGLYEMLFAVLVAITCVYLARRPRPPGFFTGLTMLVYAPTRFAMDFLRAHDVHDADPRYFALTPAQWISILMAAAGAYLLVHACRSGDVGTEPFEAATEGVDLTQFAPKKRAATS